MKGSFASLYEMFISVTSVDKENKLHVKWGVLCKLFTSVILSCPLIQWVKH